MRQKLREIIALAKRSPWRVRVALILLALYLACPFDLIPDFIPVLGQLDDILIIGLVGAYVMKYQPEFAQYLPQRKEPSGDSPVRGRHVALDPRIHGVGFRLRRHRQPARAARSTIRSSQEGTS